MWKLLKSLLGISKSSRRSSESMASGELGPWILRDGKSVQPDEAWAASTSGDLPRMLSALKVKTNEVDRHFLLMTIVAETYKRRGDPRMAKKCAEVAELHIAEFPQIAPHLEKELGVLPRVTTFQQYATLLIGQLQFDRAIEVCEAAIHFGLHDGTKSGFEGRIERIHKKRNKHTGGT